MVNSIEAMKLALEATERQIQMISSMPIIRREKGEVVFAVPEAAWVGLTACLNDLRQAIEQAEQAQPVEAKRLRRGDVLRCIETNDLCTVWFTSTTGKTLVKWRANDFGEYTAEQIGDLFWLEPTPNELELAAEQSDNYAAFHAGYRFATAHPVAQQPEQKPVGYADKIAFESAMKVGKGCDVWPFKGDYETRTGRALITIYTAPPPRQPLTDVPEIAQRVMRFAGKTMRTARNPNITARECIELANWLAAHGIKGVS